MPFISRRPLALITAATEFLKSMRALADRDEYYGDPNFVTVPLQQLLSDQYTKMRRGLIDPRKASLELRPGDPYNMKPTKPPTITGPWQGGTTVVCVSDKFGNVIAATPSGLSSTAGVAGRTGIIHGSRLSSLTRLRELPTSFSRASARGSR